MKIIGIVSEYNPFHNGHAYQVQKSIQELDADGVIAIMSGNFVQRGHPAFMDKWTRAKMAVVSGVNLVIELPTYFATSSAEAFAYGAVALLESTGVVTHLSFGSETDHLNVLKEIAYALVFPNEVYQDSFSLALEKGISFPAARSQALQIAYPDLMANIDLNQSNTILVIEYLKALIQLESNIEPFLVKRIGKSYHDTSTNDKYVSATGIREALYHHQDITSHLPKEAYDILSKSIYSPVFMKDFETMLLYRLRLMTKQELALVRDVNEGLENKIVDGAVRCSSYEDLTNHLKSKRYTMTRINRVLTNALLNINQDKLDLREHGYIRVLAFDEVGQKILRQMKKNGYYPIITNINKHQDYLKDNPLMQLDIRASNLYQLSQRDIALRIGGRDYLEKPYMHQKIGRNE